MKTIEKKDFLKLNGTSSNDAGAALSLKPRDVDLLIPKLAKNSKYLESLQSKIDSVSTNHRLIKGDSRNLKKFDDESIHLVVTSPPYWTLKKYSPIEGQLGHIEEYEYFLKELDKVWRECLRVLVPGGRLVIVVGDVCLSRRKHGRHQVVPLHADIQTHCRKIGFDNLAPIIWYKIANATYEAEGNGGGFLGKPYEPNAVVKHDIEFILMERKPGGYRKPDPETRLLSLIPEDKHRVWFRQVWKDLRGESTKSHPAPFPEELADRLIRMFSFVGDTVLDPFIGTGTTMAAAVKAGRHSIGIDIDQKYIEISKKRLGNLIPSLTSKRQLFLE